MPADAIYIRDQESQELWSAMPLPIREPASVYTLRHGFGYTRSQHTSHGISVEMLQFVPLEDPVKISRLKIINSGSAARRLSVTHYVDWVLGNQNNRAAPFIITEIEPQTRRAPGAQSLDHGFSAASRVHGHGGQAASLYGGSRGIHRPLRVAGRAGGAAQARALGEAGGRRVWIPAARCRRRSP